MSAFWRYRRSIASARLMVDYGVERGVAAEILLHGSGLPADRRSDAQIEIEAGQELQVASNLVAALGEPTLLGARVGQRYQVSTYGIWGFGLIASPTLAGSLALALRYLPLTFVFGAIRVREEGRLAFLRFEEPDLSPSLQAFLVARDMAAAVVLGRELIRAEFVVSSISLQAEEDAIGGARLELARLFGCAPRWSATQNELAVETTILATKLTQANPITAATCERICRDLVASRQVTPSMSESLRDHLRFVGDMETTLPQAARFLRVSPRTLKRRLSEERSSFTQIMRDLRRDTAVLLLRNDDMSVSEIGSRLGFSDASSFSQAFKRWMGVAPAVWRHSHPHPPG